MFAPVFAAFLALAAPTSSGIVGVDHPTWSPTRAEIAFSATRSDGTTEIDVAGPDGRTVRRFESAHPYRGEPWWSPNGKFLAYSGFDGRADFIATMSADGRVAPALVAYGDYASWAPDSRRLAIDAEDPVGDPTWFTVLDGTNAEPIGPRTQPVWSPHAEVIAYTGAKDSIYTIDLATRSRRRVGRGDHVAWSPDARWLALSTRKTIVVSSPRGKRRHLVFRGRTVSPPVWSPRRHMLAVLCERGVFVVNGDSGHARRVVGAFAFRWARHGLPRWSHDGRRLVMSGGRRLYIVGADGRHAHFVSLTEAHFRP